ncbi:MAG TPA: hypothetical protein VI877_00520, partial [Dehalococcoidia bacterium]|nr:hypothetical protein [Dehalococcoidia bacterium]
MAEEVTLEELLACVMAREAKNYKEVLGWGGGGLSGLLAQKLYNSTVGVYTATGFVLHGGELRGRANRPDEEDIEIRFKRLECLDMVSAGKWVITMGPVQVDQYGNANVALIGDWKHPAVALVGPRGLPGNTVNCDPCV